MEGNTFPPPLRAGGVHTAAASPVAGVETSDYPRTPASSLYYSGLGSEANLSEQRESFISRPSNTSQSVRVSRWARVEPDIDIEGKH